MPKKSKMSAGNMMALGAGAVALGATAYYFLGANGKAHQKSAKKTMKKWTVEAKKKIISEIKKQKEITKDLYEEIVDKVLHTYKVEGVTMAEVIDSAKVLKQDWKHIVNLSKKEAKSVAGKVKTEAKKIRRKVKGKKA